MTKGGILALATILTVQAGAADNVEVAKKALSKWRDTLGIDRPWDDLVDVEPALKRHRGALAHVFVKLKGRGLVKQARAHFYQDLARLLTLKSDSEVMKSKPAFTDYPKHFEIHVFTLWKFLITRKTPRLRWDKTYRDVYYSRSEGTGIPFEVELPPNPGAGKRLPLVVEIARGPYGPPSKTLPYIRVLTRRRGVWGPRYVGAVDTLATIDFMKRHYPVDPDRVTVTGFSNGASEAMQTASCRPDIFAGVMPLVAMGSELSLQNFRNLPVAVHHGTIDWTSSICNVWAQHAEAKRLGLPMIVKEYPGKGHTVPKPHTKLVRWLLKQKRNLCPTLLTHTCEVPEWGQAYWLRITEFVDPHLHASIEGSLDGLADKGVVKIKPENVQAFTLDLKRLSSARKPVKSMRIAGQRRSADDAKGELHCRLVQGKWQVVTDETKSARRPYRAGSAANLFQGEPLMVVYGTGGKEDRVQLLKQAGQSLAMLGGPPRRGMKARFPLRTDTDLKPDEEANYNLILVGTPSDSQRIRALIKELPLTVANKELNVADRPPLSLKGQVLSLLHPHPRHPSRLIYLVMPFLDANGMKMFGKKALGFLAGETGFDRISQPDLMVMDLRHRIGRAMQFDKEWKWIKHSGAKQRLVPDYRDRADLARAYIRVMHRARKADFATWWGPKDKGFFGHDFNYLQSFNPETYTKADFATQHRKSETLIGGVTGADLKDIWTRWGATEEISFEPKVAVEKLDAKKEYRIQMPVDMYISLTRRHKNLIRPRLGPPVSSEEVTEELFGKKK